MKRSTKVLAVTVALTIACVSVDAGGLLGRFRRPQCVPCEPIHQWVRTRPPYDDPPKVKTVYYCVGGIWMPRACGRDHEALTELALAEGKTNQIAETSTDEPTISISLFATVEDSDGVNFIIAPFGSLDGKSCDTTY